MFSNSIPHSFETKFYSRRLGRCFSHHWLFSTADVFLTTLMPGFSYGDLKKTYELCMYSVLTQVHNFFSIFFHFWILLWPEIIKKAIIIHCRVLYNVLPQLRDKKNNEIQNTPLGNMPGKYDMICALLNCTKSLLSWLFMSTILDSVHLDEFHFKMGIRYIWYDV